MQIQWLGQSCFKIQSKNSGQETTILMDPYGDDAGPKPPKAQADIITFSHNPDSQAIKADGFIINAPGEYETRGVFIYGVPIQNNTKDGKENATIFKINSEDLTIAHLNNLNQELNDEQLERLGNVDILLLPVGGHGALDAKKATEIVSAIEPRIVIPMHYQIPGLKSKLDSVEAFVKESGLPSEKMDKLKIAKKDLPAEETKIVILNP